jgi:hypothetical protein
VNPMIGFTQIIGSIASLLGIGSSLTNQAMIMHRELQQPPQQAQVQPSQRCPLGTTPVVIIRRDGTREIACMQEQQP